MTWELSHGCSVWCVCLQAVLDFPNQGYLLAIRCQYSLTVDGVCFIPVWLEYWFWMEGREGLTWQTRWFVTQNSVRSREVHRNRNILGRWWMNHLSITILWDSWIYDVDWSKPLVVWTQVSNLKPDKIIIISIIVVIIIDYCMILWCCDLAKLSGERQNDVNRVKLTQIQFIL